MFRETKKFLLLMTAVVMLATVVVGCNKKSGGGDSESILIGVMVPTSGTEAQYGGDMYRSYHGRLTHDG